MKKTNVEPNKTVARIVFYWFWFTTLYFLISVGYMIGKLW